MPDYCTHKLIDEMNIINGVLEAGRTFFGFRDILMLRRLLNEFLH